MNDKISKKAVWGDLVSLEDEKLSPTLYGQLIQPLPMMVCYKCSQVIPDNSAFCPWCQTELFVTCPKCGNKYSSQYPACNQCGTDLKLYTLEQKQRKKAKKARKEKKRREEEERYKILLEIEKKDSIRRKRKIEEDRMISNSKEFLECYESITNMLKKRNTSLKMKWIYSLSFILLLTLLDLLLYLNQPEEVLGIPIDANNIVDKLNLVIGYSIVVCFTVLPFLLWYTSLSAKCREAWINSYLNKITIPLEILPLVISVVENMKKLGGASHKKLMKHLPNLIRTSYGKVYRKAEC